ncbi:MAG: hypothetical protein WAL85_02510 [Candidatus Korobacteraceae bacterium]
MPLFGFVLLSMFLSAAAGPAAQPTWIATVENLPALNESGEPQSFQLSPTDTPDDIVLSPSDDVCYKIRAYIFRRDDDHAPELVGSTTCGPRKAQVKDAAWPKAKLVPAK